MIPGEAGGDLSGLVVLSVYAHDDPSVAHEAVRPSDFVQSNFSHLSKEASSSHTGEGRCYAHVEDSGDPASAPRLLSPGVYHGHRVHC